MTKWSPLQLFTTSLYSRCFTTLRMKELVLNYCLEDGAVILFGGSGSQGSMNVKVGRS